MDLLRIWEWSIWQWVGEIFASQPFLNLMVPVATLSGVVITTRSNERIRRRDQRAEEKRWRYEVEKSNALAQRAAVMTFLDESHASVFEMQQRVDVIENSYVLKGLDQQQSFVEARIDLLIWHLNKLHPMVTRLELAISDKNVSAEIGALRSALIELEDEIERLSSTDSASSIRWLKENFPEYRKELGPVKRIKEATIKYLQPVPPENIDQKRESCRAGLRSPRTAGQYAVEK